MDPEETGSDSIEGGAPLEVYKDNQLVSNEGESELPALS